MAQEQQQEPIDLAKQTGWHWQTWRQFLRLLIWSAAAIFIVLALMWTFLV